MKRIILFGIILCSIFNYANAQEVRLSSDSLMQSLVGGEYDLYVKKNYQPIVELAGGEGIYGSMIKATKDAWKAAGFVTEGYSYIGESKLVDAGDEKHCIVTYEVYYNMGGEKFVGKTYLLGILKNNTWSFVDLESYDRDGIKDFITNYNFELGFPDITGPEMVVNRN